MIIEDENDFCEKLRETKEMRLVLNDLSRKAKEDILSGITMFEAGYNVGYADGLNTAEKRNCV